MDIRMRRPCIINNELMKASITSFNFRLKIILLCSFKEPIVGKKTPAQMFLAELFFKVIIAKMF
jgi:hypothetical protein